MNSSSPRLAILGSGTGSNARALLKFFQTSRASQKSDLHSSSCRVMQELYYEPALIISDIADAGILKLGDEFQVPAHFFDPGPFKTKFSPEREEQLVSLLREFRIDFIALAGFMRIIKEPLLTAFPKRILNIHPSLLPMFPGLAAWQQAIDANATESGCTVHLVDGGIDTGEMLAQTRVPIFQNDTATSLHARIQAAEHELYPRVVNEFAQLIRIQSNE